jgi:exoribonuclease R
VVSAALAIANGKAVPPSVTEAFAKLPAVMARADALGSRIERASIDLAEAVLLDGREGETFQAIVTEVDQRGARIQLCDLPVIARIGSVEVEPGLALPVTLVKADPGLGTIEFQPAKDGK